MSYPATLKCDYLNWIKSTGFLEILMSVEFQKHMKESG